MLSDLLKSLDDATQVAAKAKAKVEEAVAAQAMATSTYQKAVEEANATYSDCVAHVRSLEAEVKKNIDGTIGNTEDRRVEIR